MDDRRFDVLTKSLATDTNRRMLLKGLLSFGGAVLLETRASRTLVYAARRPTPQAPPTITCPGIQIPVGDQCQCPEGNAQCGPDCCPIGEASCCDNACCYGVCYGEELCCPHGSTYCEATGTCCGPDQYQCCGSLGCCQQECCPTPTGSTCCEGEQSRCCPGSSDECPGCQICQAGACVDDNSACPGCLSCWEGECVVDEDGCAEGFACQTDGSCVEICRDAGESCAGNNCCDDLICKIDPSSAPNRVCGTCVESGEPCFADECCGDLICIPQEISLPLNSICGSCRGEGEPCRPIFANLECCEGYHCKGEFFTGVCTKECAETWEPCSPLGIGGQCCAGSQEICQFTPIGQVCTPICGRPGDQCLIGSLAGGCCIGSYCIGSAGDRWGQCVGCASNGVACNDDPMSILDGAYRPCCSWATCQDGVCVPL
jgi:hypothetical protein